MPLVHIVILAVVQGVAEFLPISSSGHLVIVEALLGESQDRSDVNVILHMGTLGSILVFYRRKLIDLLSVDRRVIGALVVATLPAALIGVVIERSFEGLLENALLAGVMLIATGTMLLCAKRIPLGTGRYQDLTLSRSLFIGVCQAAALIPGVSRSGTTITAGLACGLARDDAAAFSFLMAIPVIAGASALKLYGLGGQSEVTTPVAWLLIGAVVAFGVGIISLQWLLRWLRKGRLDYFGYWCIGVGLAVVAWQQWSAAPAEGPDAKGHSSAASTRLTAAVLQPPDPPTHRWSEAIARFELEDERTPPPRQAVVFVGSSSIRMWDLEKYFPEFASVNRGFGGSELSDAVFYADRIVLPYQPRCVVLYAGDNDIARGKSADQVVADYRAFVEKIHTGLPEANIVYVAIKPSLARWDKVEAMRAANSAIRDIARQEARQVFVDIDRPMIGDDGRPRPELFIEDGLHLSPAGYRLWTSLVKPHLLRDR